MIQQMLAIWSPVPLPFLNPACTGAIFGFPKLGKEFVKAVCCLRVYLTYMQSTYIMWTVGLDEAQAGVKFAGRIINNLGHADDTTLGQKVKRN